MSKFFNTDLMEMMETRAYHSGKFSAADRSIAQEEARSLRNTARALQAIQTIAETITDTTSHAYIKHHMKSDEFNDPKFGEPLNIHSSDDLKQHALAVLLDSETKTVHTRGTMLYAYHAPSETVIILSAHGRMCKDGGTLYRRFPECRENGESWYKKLVSLEAERMGVDGFEEKPGGLFNRLQEDPSLTEAFIERYVPLLQAKNQMHDGVVAGYDGIKSRFHENANSVTQRIVAVVATENDHKPAPQEKPPQKKIMQPRPDYSRN